MAIANGLSLLPQLFCLFGLSFSLIDDTLSGFSTSDFRSLSVQSFHSCVLFLHVRARVVSRPRRSTNVQRDTTSGGGPTSPSWIWVASSNGSASTSPGTVAFIKNITTPSGKTASRAVIELTAVDNFTLFVNGQPIGASGAGDWKSAQLLRAALNTSVNTFSVLVANSGKSDAPPPGLLAAIQVSYSDSTNATFPSDSSWLAATKIPPKFPMPSNLSSFTPAAVAAPYGSGPWGQNISLPSPDPTPLTLNGSNWIWSTANASKAADVGSVGFRKPFPTPSGKSAQLATILLTVDNNFALYLNGQYVGTPPGVTSGRWDYAQQFTVKLNATMNVFTVIAQNFPSSTPHSPRNAAGFIAAIKISYLDGTTETIYTDSTWLNSNLISLPAFLSTPDVRLSASVVLGKMGMLPWKQLTGISDALSAASVPRGPFSDGSSALASSTSHSVPIGAIVGAVVGALAVVALLVGLLIWRRRRRNLHAAAKEATAFTTGVPFSEYGPNTVSTMRPFSRLHSFTPSRGKLDTSSGRRMSDMPQNEEAEAPPPSYAAAARVG
ncbi:hypothetical protein B0H19DRAFT_1261613 [Mycena capillaripes]|nr:hypothetical protein B0H19DRAFT_1261613 [Mycena capillaripes]